MAYKYCLSVQITQQAVEHQTQNSDVWTNFTVTCKYQMLCKSVQRFSSWYMQISGRRETDIATRRNTFFFFCNFVTNASNSSTNLHA